MKGKVATLLVAATLATAAFAAVRAQDSVGQGHMAIPDPAELSKRQAAEVYDRLKEGMARGYALSHVTIVADYQTWARHNSAPYVSATHGRRYINNYANERGSAYGSLGAGEKFPAGTVIAKDSFTMTRDGEAFPGALFVMEKLEEGKNPATGDWRYLVINPDGSLFGDTLGETPQDVEYCHACHKAKAGDDYVFYVPESYWIAK